MPEVIRLFLSLLLNALWLAVIGRAILSWFDPHFGNPISRFLFDVTEPILQPIRSIMPGGMMIDFSPMVAIVIISILQRAI
jgi:YggT family protein